MKKEITRWGFCFSILIMASTLNAQSQISDKLNHKIYNNYIGLENNEINNGRYYINKYRTIDNTHVFFESHIAYDGIVLYKNQTFYTKLRYDIVNDLIVIKYINNSSAFSLSLTPELIEEVRFNNHTFVILPNTKIFYSFYGNGLFEEIYKGTNFDLYIKHVKKVNKKFQNDLLLSFTVKETNFVIKYKNKFYKITKRKELIKDFPQFKDDIKHFILKNKEITTQSLFELVKQIDK